MQNDHVGDLTLIYFLKDSYSPVAENNFCKTNVT